MTSLVVQCATCKHYITGMTCLAFKAIPQDVWFSRVSHTTPIKGDHGFQYEGKVYVPTKPQKK